MVRLFVITFCVFCSIPVVAQIDTSVILENVDIKASSVRSDGERTELLLNDRPIQNGSIATTLEQNSNTYIKNYGPGSLSTFSIRGGSAGQSLVLWNGLPLHSPMLGLLDLSLIPSNITEQASLTKGGSSAMWGSGAISGVLSLDSRKNNDYTLINTTSIGSFGTLGENLSINLSNGRWHSTSKFIHESSDRNFEYEISPNLPLIKQPNARFHRNHLVQDLYFDLNKNDQLSAHIWTYNASTQIPPTTVQSKSIAYQDDSAIRSIISYKHIGEKSLLEGKIGYYNDHNNFYDESILLEALNSFDTWFADLNGQLQKGNHTFSLGGTFNYTNATSEGYKGTADERKLGVFVTHLYETNKFKVKSSVRQEVIDNTWVPVTPNLTVSYFPLIWLKTYAKISRDYRTPTLNDRFWKPGGNEELLPESGWSQEIGFKLSKKNNNITGEYSTALFYRDIKNWILWSPGQGVPFWSAQNINNVVSKGIEQALSIKYNYKTMTVGFDLSHNYISSAFQTALTIPKVEAGDQLLYNPKHTGRSSVFVEWQEWKMKYQHSYTGETRGVNEMLPSFTIGNLMASFNSSIGNIRYAININLNNIYNNRYFIIERRPIAGRNYNIGITIKY